MLSLKLKALITVITVLTGSGVAAYQTGIISKPGFGVQDRGDWQNVSESSIGLKSTAWLNNDNPVSLNFSQLQVKYRLKMNGVQLAEGAKQGVAIDKGNQTVEVETTLFQQKIPKWWVSHLRNGEKTNVAVVLGVNRKIFGFPIKLNGFNYRTEINTDIEKIMNSAAGKLKGKYSGPALGGVAATKTDIEIKGGSAEFGEITRRKTNIKFDLKVHNLNDYPIPTPQLVGDLKMNGVKMAEINSQPVNSVSDSKIDAHATRELRFKTAIDNSKMDDWLTSHVRNNERTDARMDIRLRFEQGDVSFTVPSEPVKCNFSFQTGIMIDDQNSSTTFSGCKSPGNSYYEKTDSKTGNMTDDVSNSTEDTKDQTNDTKNSTEDKFKDFFG